jgi:hypothetical protein
MGSQLPVKNQNVFEPSSTVIAGFLVKHPLYDCKFLLMGFSIPYVKEEEINVQAMEYYHTGFWRDIFLKVIIDMQQHETTYFETSPNVRKCNYYFYKNRTDKYPEMHSNEIFEVCKYREDGLTKHIFFNLHEITPDI